jgi:hypothetical protein
MQEGYIPLNGIILSGANHGIIVIAKSKDLRFPSSSQTFKACLLRLFKVLLKGTASAVPLRPLLYFGFSR